jgi:hypothetical protein
VTVARQSKLQPYWKAIRKLEAKRKSRIFSLIHCSDEDDHICAPTLESVIAERRNLTNIDTLELLLHSGGGIPDIAYQVVRFFRRRCKRFHVIVPYTAKSAATLMCLGADAIYMAELADLGPIDVQLTDPLRKGAKQISPLDEFKSTEFLRDYAVEVLDFITSLVIRRSGMSVSEALNLAVPFTTGIMRPLYEQLDPLEIGEYKRALAIGEQYAHRLLALTKNPRREEIVNALIYKYPSHGFAIDAVEARAIGLPVHALNSAQEDVLLDAMDVVLSNGESVYGFPKMPPSGTAQKTPAKKKQTAPSSQPALVASRGA